MKYTQGDIVIVNFLFPTGGTKKHPVIIVSNNKLQEDEAFFYVVMISSSNNFQKYAYELTDEMLTKKLPEKSYVKCQLIPGYTERDVIKKHGKIKQFFLQEIIDKTIDSIF
ncbi:MAG: type II toxin-antitoxin system PemK/MazF family toxin [Dysgonamonadaceae bacterium]|jgi:mRNA-degrading endonuclease toxin of MazEF toxin-antitoxin module|nr:type II toxin-antitoxin system PemK/MazF family toxin [Dysgonamonadaceae bacterium]